MQTVLGSMRLAEISHFDLERYRRQRKQAGMSDVTINRELAFLRHLYTMAHLGQGERESGEEGPFRT